MMDKNSLLKQFCGELVEKALATTHGVSTCDMFDENGCFYEHYQDLFNRLYDFAEEQILLINENDSVNVQ